MLGEVGLLTEQEVTTLVGGLRGIAREVDSGTFPWRDELEDVHTNVEVRLTEKVGPLGGKLHTARSRNDQVALDERLYLRAAVAEVAHRLVELEETLCARAAETRETPMPGYTHLQRAQPVTVAHYLLAHFWRFDRDLNGCSRPWVEPTSLPSGPERSPARPSGSTRRKWPERWGSTARSRTRWTR